MGMSWPGEKETRKAYSSTKEVSKYPYNSACTLCPPGMCWGLWSSSQSCAGCKGFMPMQLNQDNCADEAVDAAFISKKKVKLLDRFMLVFSRTGEHSCSGRGASVQGPLVRRAVMDKEAQQWQPHGTEAPNSPGSDWKPHIKKFTSLPAGFLSTEPSPPRPVYPQALLSGSAGTTSTREQPRAAPKKVSDKVPSDLDGNRSWHKMLQVIAWSHCDSTLSKSIFRLNFILQIESRIQFLCLAGIVFALQESRRRRRNNSNVPHNYLHVF